MSLLQVADLQTQFHTRHGVVQAVDGVSFTLDAGETLAIVGESGSGKSATALSIIGLLPAPRGRIAGGAIRLDGRDLTSMGERELDDVRGRDIGMVFQDPLGSLNPSFTIGRHLVETLQRHLPLSKSEAQERAVELLEEVRIPSADRRVRDYPHQLSGGMRQRVMIALALACGPRLLIADEPTTALDVTIQADVLALLDRLRDERDLAMILITHDMGVAAAAADRIAVMYAGQLVEEAPATDLFERPEHPYTAALLGALPPVDAANVRHGRLAVIPGSPPSLIDPPATCRFRPRCPYASDGDACAGRMPELREIRPGHLVRTAHPVSERAARSVHV
jgi:oligopeptide/dipeptide ABC transporter ATP-binding protein